MTDVFGPRIMREIGVKRSPIDIIPRDHFKYEIGMHVAYYHAYYFLERS
jgi:hypothetical protein